MKSPVPRPRTSHDVAQATAQLRDEHEQATSPLQHAVDRFTAALALPGFVAALALGIVLWCGGNVLAAFIGVRPLDPPPFGWLEALAATGALLVAALILTNSAPGRSALKPARTVDPRARDPE